MWTRQDIAWPTTIRGTTATAIDRVGIIRPSTIITSRGREEAEEEVVVITTATVDEAVVAAVEVVTVAIGRTITHTEEVEEEEDTSKEDPSRISTRIGMAEWPVGVEEEEVDSSIRAAIVAVVVDTRAKAETTVTGAVVEEDREDKEDRDKAGATRTRTTSNAAIKLKYN